MSKEDYAMEEIKRWRSEFKIMYGASNKANIKHTGPAKVQRTLKKDQYYNKCLLLETKLVSVGEKLIRDKQRLLVTKVLSRMSRENK